MLALRVQVMKESKSPGQLGRITKDEKKHPRQKLGDGQSGIAKGTVRWMIHAKDKTLSSCIGTSSDVQQASCFHSR